MDLLAAVEKCKHNDREAQRQIYQLLSQKMFGVCMRYAQNREEAEDILHDGFIQIFNKICDFRGDGSFEGWARRIFTTIALSRIRRRTLYQKESSLELADNIPNQTPTAIASMEAEQILECMEQLPEKYRAILNLYSIEGYTHKEIADQMQITSESSRVCLLRAKSALAKLLEDAGLM